MSPCSRELLPVHAVAVLRIASIVIVETPTSQLGRPRTQDGMPVWNGPLCKPPSETRQSYYYCFHYQRPPKDARFPQPDKRPVRAQLLSHRHSVAVVRGMGTRIVRSSIEDYHFGAATRFVLASAVYKVSCGCTKVKVKCEQVHYICRNRPLFRWLKAACDHNRRAHDRHGTPRCAHLGMPAGHNAL